jgi:hypothetical protein
MNFGQSFTCSICKKDIDGDYHRYTSDMLGMDFVFYTCAEGKCNEVFRGEYVEPFVDKPIKSRWQILDIPNEI